MQTITLTIINKTGLHARPAAAFSRAAATFKSNISICNLDKNLPEQNAKSVSRVLTLGLAQGNRVQIQASGEDEQEAIRALSELIEAGFGEL